MTPISSVAKSHSLAVTGPEEGTFEAADFPEHLGQSILLGMAASRFIGPNLSSKGGGGRIARIADHSS